MAKATKKQALGRGLSALLKDPQSDIKTATDTYAEKVIGNIAEIEIANIETNPFQPRTRFDQEALEELAASISELGLVQPITVRKLGFNKYQLVSGERRFRASQMAGLDRLPAYIRIANDQEMLEMALVENIQRKDLDAIEVSMSYQRLIDECDLTQEQLSKRVGKKRSTITNYLRLLKLDPIIQSGIRDNMITMGHGRALINIEDTSLQLDIYEKLVREGLSVRQTEALVKLAKEGQLNQQKAPVAKQGLPSEFIQVQKELKDHLGSDVAISRSKSGKGKITISFQSDADFERLKKFFL